MKYVLTGVLALSLLTACGQKDKLTGKAALASIEFDAAGLEEAQPRDGDPATAAQALEALYLHESGAGLFTFAAREIDGDRAVFSDVSLVLPQSAAVGEPLFSDEEIAEIFSWMDYDGDGIADDGSEMTIEEYAAFMNGESEVEPMPVVRAARLELDGLAMVEDSASFSLIRFSDVSITPAEGSEDQSSGTVGHIELVNPSVKTAAWIAGLMEPGVPPPVPEGADLAFDRWSVGDLDFSISDASGSGELRLGSVFVDGMNSGVEGSIGLSGLAFRFDESDLGDVSVNLDGFGVNGIDFAMLIAAAGSAGDPAAAASALQVDPANPGFDAMLMKGFKADVSGASIDMPSLSSVVGRDKEDRATRIATDPFTITVTPRQNAEGEMFAGMLAMLGYDSLSLSAAGEQLYDPDADMVTLPKGRNYWQLDDGFRFEMSAKYEGAKALSAASGMAAAQDDPEAMLEVLMTKLAIHQFELAIKDSGFFNRALNAAATQAGQDPEQLRGQISGGLAMAPMIASGSGVDPAIVNELAGAVSAFVRDPKTLRISLQPPSPLSGEAFMEAAADPAGAGAALNKARLGFSAANE